MRDTPKAALAAIVFVVASFSLPASAQDCTGWISCPKPKPAATVPAPAPKPVAPVQQPQAQVPAPVAATATPAQQAAPQPQQAAVQAPPPKAQKPASTAQGKPPAETPAPEAGPFYLGLELGLAPVANLTSDFSDYYSAAGATDGQVSQRPAALGGRLFAGFELTDNIALELGAGRLGTSLTAEGHAAGEKFKDTYDSSWNIIDYSVLLRPGASSSLHGLFLRVGSHSTTNKTTVTLNSLGLSSVGDSKTQSGLLLGLGYDLTLGQRKAHVLRFAYSHYDNVPDLSDELEIGKGILENNTLDVFTFGYLYKF